MSYKKPNASRSAYFAYKIKNMEQKISIGSVLKPQGIRGEVKVKVFLDSAEELKSFKRVLIGGEEYAVMSVRAQGEFAYTVLRGIADRNAAELLRGKEIEVFRSELPKPPDGRYYIADLTGCEVVTASGEQIGTVASVTPAKTDVYTLETPKGEVSFAAADGVIESVDVANKRITVNKKRFKEVSL